MLLASTNVLGPVTGMGLLVVQKSSDTELLGGRPVPAGPVAGAGGLVAEDSVQPVAVFRRDGWVCGRGKEGGSGKMRQDGQMGRMEVLFVCSFKGWTDEIRTSCV